MPIFCQKNIHYLKTHYFHAHILLEKHQFFKKTLCSHIFKKSHGAYKWSLGGGQVPMECDVCEKAEPEKPLHPVLALNKNT